MSDREHKNGNVAAVTGILDRETPKALHERVRFAWLKPLLALRRKQEAARLVPKQGRGACVLSFESEHNGVCRFGLFVGKHPRGHHRCVDDEAHL